MGVYQATAGPHHRSDASPLERARKLVASVACKDCGRPSTITFSRICGGTTRRTCLCRDCHDRAEARRARAAAQMASLGR